MDTTVLALATLSAVLVGVSAVLLIARRQKSTVKDVAVVEDASDREVVRVFYGTQTGTAEKFAKDLTRKLGQRYSEQLRFVPQDIEAYDHEAQLGSERLLIYLVATYGDGEPTDNTHALHAWLEPKADAVFAGDAPAVLENTPFAVFGLGNKQYEHFNAMGKFVHKHLAALGGAPLVPLGLGDDDSDITDDFEVWCDALFERLDAEGTLPKASRPSMDVTLAREGYTVRTVPSSDLPARKDAPIAPWVAESEKHAHEWVHVAEVRELHAEASERSCVHVELDLDGTSMTYEHGDHVAIYPRNSPHTVAAACIALGWDADAAFVLSTPPGNPELLPAPFPGPITVRDALAHHVELLQHPDKGALLALAQCAANEKHAARLRWLAGHEGKADFASYILDAKRSLIEVLQDFRSVKVPIGLFFAHVAPRLQPRYYSISSSPLVYPRAVHVTAAVVDEMTPTGRRHEGVATGALARASDGEPFAAFIRTSTFRLPRDPRKPLVMIGPGTGIAPFRGFLQHRAARGDPGAAHLFFGCRHPDRDYIYRDELAAARAAGVLSSLSVAFSRVASTKDYVQDHLIRARCEMWECLEAGGALYVCGDAKHMAKDVHRAVHELVAACNGWGGHEAEAYVARLQKEGRYLQDVW